MIIQEYGGYANPESVKFVKVETREVKFRNMEMRIGEVQEIPITLLSGFVGQFSTSPSET